jgi:hypothetical protein
MLLAFSCKRRGFCPSYAGRCMAQMAAHLVERVLSSTPESSLAAELKRFDQRVEELERIG